MTTKMSQVLWQLLYLLAKNPNYHLFLCSPTQSLAMWGLSLKPILYYSSNSNTRTHAYSFIFRTLVKNNSKIPNGCCHACTTENTCTPTQVTKPVTVGNPGDSLRPPSNVSRLPACTEKQSLPLYPSLFPPSFHSVKSQTQSLRSNYVTS